MFFSFVEELVVVVLLATEASFFFFLIEYVVANVVDFFDGDFVAYGYVNLSQNNSIKKFIIYNLLRRKNT